MITRVLQDGFGRSRRGIGVGAFVLGLITVGALAHVAVRMKGIEVAYELGKERRVNAELEEQRRRLNIEIGMLKDPVRIVSMAREKLDLAPPSSDQIVALGRGGGLALRAPEARRPEPAPSRKPSAPAAPSAARAQERR